MKTFMYTVTFDKTGRDGGRKFSVSVWRIKQNKPIFLGKEEGNTAAWEGASLTAHKLISEKTGAALSVFDRLPCANYNVIELQTVQK